MLRSLIAAVLVCVLQAAAAASTPITAREDAMRTIDPSATADFATPQRASQRRVVISVPSAVTVAPLGSERTLISFARSQLGVGAVYGRRSLWCARFMNWALERSGFRGTRSDLARSFLALPHTSPHVGAIAVLGRGGRFGHVGIVTGFDARGNPIIISGNHGHHVGEGTYPRRRILAYVSPV